jgi:hypothetical protein
MEFREMKPRTTKHNPDARKEWNVMVGNWWAGKIRWDLEENQYVYAYEYDDSWVSFTADELLQIAHFVRQSNDTEGVTCTCPEGPKLGRRKTWAKPRCGKCHLYPKGA